MTAVAAPAPLAGGPRPVQWTKLVWVTWRQHRAALAGVAVLLGGVGLYLLIMGVKIHSGYASVTSCHPPGSAACGLADQLFKTKGIKTSRSAVQRFGAKIGIRRYRPTYRYLRGDPAKQARAQEDLADLGKERRPVNSSS